MPNIASVLKDEISRLARREIRAETEKLKKASAQYRANIAELKRQVADLQRDVTRLSRMNGAAKPPVAAAAAEKSDASKVRWSPARLKRHRERLDLSAERFGKLFGVTGQTIYNWEAGTRPAHEHLVRIAHLRNLTQHQAHVIVDSAQ